MTYLEILRVSIRLLQFYKFNFNNGVVRRIIHNDRLLNAHGAIALIFEHFENAKIHLSSESQQIMLSAGIFQMRSGEWGTITTCRRTTGCTNALSS
ncbi:hypothetical protein Trydic_g3218 [Trypoxylus dichotomus]